MPTFGISNLEKTWPLAGSAPCQRRRWATCARGAAPIYETQRYAALLALLPRLAGRAPALGGSVLWTVADRPPSSIAAFQKGGRPLVGSSRTTLSGASCGAR